MNLHFRLLAMLVVRWWRARKGQRDPLSENPLLTTRKPFRVWPHDCDMNIHLTSSRYLALMDLCRVDWLLALGVGRILLKKRWKFVVNAQEITYIREVKPFCRFDIKSRVLGWDEKYFYVEHRVVRKGKLHAIAHVRAACLERGQVITMGKMLNDCGFSLESPPLPEAISLWRGLLDHKKWVNKRTDTKK